jgi:hypothetical protein
MYSSSAKMDGLDEGLGEIGEGPCGARLNVEFIGGAGLGVFAGVVGTEVCMVGGARSAALAAIGEGETTQGLAVLWAKRGHNGLLRVELWDRCLRRAQAEACATNGKELRMPALQTETPRGKRGALLYLSNIQE